MFNNQKTRTFLYRFYIGIIIAVIFIFGFLLVKKTFAGTITAQYLTSSYSQSTSGNFSGTYRNLGQVFYMGSSSAYLDKVYFYGKNNNTYPMTNPVMKIWDLATSTVPTQSNVIDTDPLQTATTTLSGSDGEFYAQFVQNTTALIQGHYYYVAMTGTNTTGNDTIDLRGGRDNGYAGGDSYETYYNSGSFSRFQYWTQFSSGTQDLYFKVETGSSYSPAQNEITFIYPLNSTTIGDFNSYNLRYQIDATTTSNLFVSVYQSTSTPIDINTCETSTSTPCYKDRNQVFSPFINNPAYRSPLTNYDASISRSKHNFNLWYAKTVLEDNNSNPLASSTISYTTVSTIPPSYFETPTSTATSSDWTMDCTGGTIISNSLCYVLSYLFYPNQQSVFNFYSIKAKVENKPPIGYYTAIKSQINSLSTSTPIINFPTGLSNSTSSPFYLFRTGINWLLWFLFAFWIYHRIKNLEL